MNKLNLPYPEKLQLLSDLKKFYIEDFELVCDDVSPHCGYLKGTSIGLIIDCLNSFSKGVKNGGDLTIDEINFILSKVITKDYVKSLIECVNEEEADYIKSGFGCSLGVLWGDKKTIKNARKILESARGIEIKTSLM